MIKLLCIYGIFFVLKYIELLRVLLVCDSYVYIIKGVWKIKLGYWDKRCGK